jgi:hypothetical protein
MSLFALRKIGRDHEFSEGHVPLLSPIVALCHSAVQVRRWNAE